MSVTVYRSTDAGAPVLNGTSGNELLYGNDADNLINGRGGNDTLYGANTGTLAGGTGSDTYIVSSFTATTNLTIDNHEYIAGDQRA